MKELEREKQAVVKGEKYRFTVLTKALIRMEYSDKGIFVDQPTQTVVNRDFPVPEFSVKETEDMLEIITSCLRVRYDKKKFSPTGLSIRVTGQPGAGSAVWNYGDKPVDLGGTARTLDEADGSIPLESGILSAHGWSLLDDSSSLLLNEKGWIQKREDKEGTDLYFFGYGRDYLNNLKDYHVLTGKVPLLPRFAFGNWWSRYYKYTEKSYLELMDRFKKEDIPFSVAVIDMDWHLVDIDPKYGTGWTGYTWNREFFPDPEGFMENLHGRGMKVTLNVHPADGVRAFEECYPAFAEYMGVDEKAEEPVLFQVGNPDFMKGYFELIHHPLEKQGVDFWWIDWQQGSNSGVEGLDPLWMLNHYHYLDNCKNGNRGMIFSRYAGPGSHRYPIGFSGDTVISWESLDFQPFFTANASNIGYGWWSHDIGGHMMGIKDDEMAVRWLQFGVFSPILRLHSTCSEFNGKEPWRYNRMAEQVMKDFLRLRHKLIPYLYSMNVRASVEDIPLVQPMYYHNPLEGEAYQVPNQYYFGSQMVVCPITTPVNKGSGMAVFHAWLPEGKWVDLFTGLIYEGGRRVDLYREIDKIPVLVKSGGIIPMDGRHSGNEIDNPEYLEIYVCPGSDGEFTLWEDDGRESGFCRESWARTGMCYSWGESAKLTLKAPAGNLTVLPDRRKYRLHILGASKEITVKVYVDGTQAAGVCCTYDEETGIATAEIPYIETGRCAEVLMEHCKFHDNRMAGRIFDYLNRAGITFGLKDQIYHVVRQLEEGKSLVHVLGRLEQMDVPREVTGPVFEILTAL